MLSEYSFHERQEIQCVHYDMEKYEWHKIAIQVANVVVTFPADWFLKST